MSEDDVVAERQIVVIAPDFRENLIIDRYDPMFVGMRASKQKHLRSANSEDAVTWNVFRSLRQIEPGAWLPELARRGIGEGTHLPSKEVSVLLWASRCPPPGLLADGDEGDSEIDVLIEAPTWVWCIEAKLNSDISLGTTTRPARDQVLRNIDVGSFHAGVRDFYFSLLIRDERRSRHGVGIAARYSDATVVRELLRNHRPDGLANLRSISVLTWEDLASVLRVAQANAIRPNEGEYAGRAIDWLRSREIVANG